MPEDTPLHYLPKPELLTYEELLRLVQDVFLPLGIDRFRLTGGEPLVRRGVVGFVEALAKIKGVADIAMTTNGYFLEELAQDLKDAGLHRINISLDSLDSATFQQITGRPYWQKVWRGIQAAYEAGFFSLKAECGRSAGY
jgi:cyclic pyranopterin phosphate synthase